MPKAFHRENEQPFIYLSLKGCLDVLFWTYLLEKYKIVTITAKITCFPNCWQKYKVIEALFKNLHKTTQNKKKRSWSLLSNVMSFLIIIAKKFGNKIILRFHIKFPTAPKRPKKSSKQADNLWFEKPHKTSKVMHSIKKMQSCKPK